MQLAALIGALVVIAGLSAGLVFTVKKLADAHKGQNAATAELAQAHRDLYEAKAHDAVVAQNNVDFHAANERLAAELERLTAANVAEHARTLMAERQRDDLIHKLAARQDPSALVVTINEELRRLAATK